MLSENYTFCLFACLKKISLDFILFYVKKKVINRGGNVSFYLKVTQIEFNSV